MLGVVGRLPWLVGCGALKSLSDGKSGEIKAMHTVAQFRRGGLGKSMLRHILSAANERYYSRVYLETGRFAGCDDSEIPQYYELIGKYDQFVSGWTDLIRVRFPSSNSGCRSNSRLVRSQ